VINAFEYYAAARLYCYLKAKIHIDALLLIELGEGVDMDEVDYGEDVLCLAAWNSFTIREEFTTFAFDIFSELD